VRPSPARTPPLNGGIALKPDQKLIGSGPAVTRLPSSAASPRITNTTATRDSGDAVRLADGDQVSNLVILGSYRGGIYGDNVRSATISGNNLTGTNTSCTTGFVVQEFTLPTLAPGVGIPFSSGLPNGWAAILLDESAATARLNFRGNYVHDGACNDGIDVRASGTGHVTATVTGNVLTHLREGASQQSVLAIGMQTVGSSTLLANVRGNSESYIGNATSGDQGNADSEGLFANTAGPSHLTEHVTNNTDVHGQGHLSANCFEIVASNGDPTTDVSFSNSSCKDVVGDQIEEVNLTANSKMSLTVNHVRAQTTEFTGGPGFHQAEPGDDGDCLFELASGSHTTTTLRVSNSIFTGCVTDGLEVASSVDTGSGPVDKLTFNVNDSRITGNTLSNLRVADTGPITDFAGQITHTDLSLTPGSDVILENIPTNGSTSDLHLDLGGGPFSSAGHNCIYGGNPLDIEDVRDTVSARQDWWGQPGGPPAGRVLTTEGSVDTGDPLASPACGPTAGTILGPLPAQRSAGPKCVAATGHLTGRALGPVALGITRRRARRKFGRYINTKRHLLFICLSGGSGIRIAFPTQKLLSTLPRPRRSRVRGHAVLLLTASHHYALGGIRVGESVATARHRLKLSAPFRIGQNTWYLNSTRRRTGVLKVRRGIIEEIGIANRRLTAGRRAASRLLSALGA
jgi:hypothetical protein